MTEAAVATLLAPAIFAAAVIAILRHLPWVVGLADHPNERSLHAAPTPRIGGIGIAAGVLPFALYYAGGPLALILACALALALVSLADDVRDVPAPLRLAAHGLAAAGAWVAIAPGADWIVAVLAVVAIAWVTNLYNFMDGADGLAGGMAAIGFAAYALAASHSGDTALAGACAAIASASVGFLAWNFPPARVFLGDAGSIPLGFLAAALGAYGAVRGNWSLAFPFMVFSPFIVDATVTLLRRLVRGEKVWLAHRAHYYQRLVLAGWSRRRLAIAALALMLGAGASALLLERAGSMLQCGIIFFWAALYALLLVTIDRTTTKKR